MVNYFAPYVNAPMLRIAAFSDVAARIKNETPQHEISSDVAQRVRLAAGDNRGWGRAGAVEPNNAPVAVYAPLVCILKTPWF